MVKDKTFGAVLVAGLIGAAIGLLFAPKSGKQTRHDLRIKAEEVKRKGQQSADELKDAVRSNAEEVKGTLKRSAKELKELNDEARLRASRVADDAKETGQRVKADAKRRLDEQRDVEEM